MSELQKPRRWNLCRLEGGDDWLLCGPLQTSDGQAHVEHGIYVEEYVKVREDVATDADIEAAAAAIAFDDDLRGWDQAKDLWEEMYDTQADAIAAGEPQAVTREDCRSNARAALAVVFSSVAEAKEEDDG